TGAVKTDFDRVLDKYVACAVSTARLVQVHDAYQYGTPEAKKQHEGERRDSCLNRSYRQRGMAGRHRVSLSIDTSTPCRHGARLHPHPTSHSAAIDSYPHPRTFLPVLCSPPPPPHSLPTYTVLSLCVLAETPRPLMFIPPPPTEKQTLTFCFSRVYMF
ncbi:hypothetical protein BaRGS_00000871, partial [Batillaria attramentaria]